MIYFEILPFTNHMYFWNINKLKEDLKKGPLAEKDSFKYLFVFVLTYTLAMYETGDTTGAGWNMIMYLVLGLGGLYYTYKCNGGDQGKDFVVRYLAVSWVASIRWIVMVLIPAMIVFIFVKIASGSAEATFFDTIYLAALTIFVYWKIGEHLKEIAGHKREE